MKRVYQLSFNLFLSLSSCFSFKGTAESLMKHMLEENAIDTTYIEDFLLTYRVFNDEPLRMCSKLLEWFDAPIYRDKVSRDDFNDCSVSVS